VRQKVEGRLETVEERAWLADVGDVQRVAGAGAGDEEQAAFPLQVVGVSGRVLLPLQEHRTVRRRHRSAQSSRSAFWSTTAGCRPSASATTR
jgi:hypothetical protein